MTYDFTQPYAGKHPVTFAWSPTVTIHPDGRDRIKQHIGNGCSCKTIETPQATLRLRSINAAISVWLQCSGCGGSIGTALRREHHPGWQAYPKWDVDLAEEYSQLEREFYDQRRSEIPSFEDVREARRLAYEKRRQEYDIWLRSSPEWKALKALVQWRSRGRCEACLENQADAVHHLTYDFGKMPPAWHLRAVCVNCHARLHTSSDEWCDFGMARGE